MTGLLFYACCSLGLGWLIPGQIVAGHRQIGIDFGAVLAKDVFVSNSPMSLIG